MAQMAGKRWRTAITKASAQEIRVRGYDLVDLIEHVDFGSVIHLLFKGELPTPDQARMMNALLVAICDHAIAPSEAVSRVVAACGVPLQVAVAAGMLTIGDVHGGAGQEFARKIQEWVAEARARGIDRARYADELVAAHRKERKRIDGYGHPLHPQVDPRVTKLLALADRWKVAGEHVALAREIEAAITRATKRAIPLNIDGAVAAIVSDMGFDWRLARSFVFLSRAAGLTAHAHEEMAREAGWRVVATDDEVEYDGPPPRRLPGR
jgi:citrate synthase